jgi:hypothetical protein
LQPASPQVYRHKLYAILAQKIRDNFDNIAQSVVSAVKRAASFETEAYVVVACVVKTQNTRTLNLARASVESISVAIGDPNNRNASPR